MSTKPKTQYEKTRPNGSKIATWLKINALVGVDIYGSEIIVYPDMEHSDFELYWVRMVQITFAGGRLVPIPVNSSANSITYTG